MADLNALSARFQAHMTALQVSINGHDYAAIDNADGKLEEDALFEGVFMRGFTAFEEFLEAIFLHYCAGQPSLNGFVAETRLQRCSEADIRTILKGDQNYIDWSRPTKVRNRAKLFIVGGEPFDGHIGSQTGVLASIEKVRNRIAHESAEAKSAMKEVERTLFLTERPFEMGAGQLLRARRRARPFMSNASDFLAALAGLSQQLAYHS